MRNLLYIIDYFKNIDPCGEDSTCLVKAACHMRQAKPWMRTRDCPDYKAYTRRRDQINDIKNGLFDWFWIIVMISMFVFLCFIFVLGIMKFIELARNVLQ